MYKAFCPLYTNIVNIHDMAIVKFCICMLSGGLQLLKFNCVGCVQGYLVGAMEMSEEDMGHTQSFCFFFSKLTFLSIVLDFVLQVCHLLQRGMPILGQGSIPQGDSCCSHISFGKCGLQPKKNPIFLCFACLHPCPYIFHQQIQLLIYPMFCLWTHTNLSQPSPTRIISYALNCHINLPCRCCESHRPTTNE